MNGLALPARLVPPKRAYVFLATAALATLVALTIAASAARAAVVFDGSPGTAAPPATLGPHTMTPFASDARPVLADVSSVPSPLGGILGFFLLEKLALIHHTHHHEGDHHHHAHGHDAHEAGRGGA
jgi:hypothetical protein